MNLHNTYGVCIENHVLVWNFTAQEMVWPKLSGRESRKYSKLQPCARWEWEKLRTFHLDILEGCTTGDGTTSESHRIVIEICFVQALCRRSWMNVSKRRLEEKKINKHQFFNFSAGFFSSRSWSNFPSSTGIEGCHSEAAGVHARSACKQRWTKFTQLIQLII